MGCSRTPGQPTQPSLKSNPGHYRIPQQATAFRYGRVQQLPRCQCCHSLSLVVVVSQPDNLTAPYSLFSSIYFQTSGVSTNIHLFSFD